MHRPLLATVVMFLAAATAARAQSVPAPENRPSPIGFHFTYATGLTSGIQDTQGLSVSLGAEVATPLPALRLRLEGTYLERRFRDLFGMASLALSPLGAQSPFYVTAGLGGYLDNGFNTAAAFGSGVDLGKMTRLPIFLEYRLFFARTEFSVLSIGVHF